MVYNRKKTKTKQNKTAKTTRNKRYIQKNNTFKKNQ